MYKNKAYKSIFIITILLLLSVISFTQNTIACSHPHSVKGILYINNEIAPENIQIKLVFNDITETTLTYEYNLYGDNTNYNLGFWDHEEQTGSFIVVYQGQEIIPDDNQTIYIEDGVTGYIMDLHITYTIPPNNPPNKPTNPTPSNNSENISLNPMLSVQVTDLDDDTMNVSFYNASNDNLIGTTYNVPNASTATIEWPDLTYNKTYHWYAIANDSKDKTQSDTWNFKTETEEIENIPPTIKITKPQKGVYINNRKTLLGIRILRPTLIIGDITLIANATDEDQGIEKVEFYINCKLIGNDTTEPYTCNWTRNHRIRLFRHHYVITVKAYDKLGETAFDFMVVKKYL